MARKRKDKDAPAEVAGTITPGDDAPPVDVQGVEGTPGEYDGNGIPDGVDAPEPIGVTGEDDAPVVPVEDMPPVEVASVDGEEPAPVAPTGDLSSLEADPGTDMSANREKKGRYDTPEKKAERNRKEREKRERKAAENAARAGKVARATGVATNAAKVKAGKDAAPVTPAPGQAAAAAVTDTTGVDLSVLLGLSFHAIAMAVPEKWGGGTLTPAERDLLGKAWAGPLAPYLSGAAGPWAVAAISTVQVFALRAMMYQPPAAPAPVVHSPRPAAPGSSPAAPVAPVAPPAAPAAPAGRVVEQEPGVGGE